MSHSGEHTVSQQAAASLSVEAVNLTYQTARGPLEALKGLSLDVAPGEFVSLLGPSGCGKSTLLKLVTGLISPTSGTIRLAGNPVRGPRREVGIVFQQPTLLPWKTVLENILVPIRAMGIDAGKKRMVALSLLETMNLAAFAHHYPSELSGGMQQRVGIARGLIHDPTVLLMDEPFAALDALTRESMTDELQRIWMATKKSVLFITHSISESIYLADRIVVLSARPGHALYNLAVDLPRPRTIDTMSDPRFSSLAKQLREIFHEMRQA
ncbi:ABC transporter ATP-binding protein [Bradyrhizobium tropiciagri]|nr:ABC transporter ATP-binding protein [Bradyrhizobium tropiciagri]